MIYESSVYKYSLKKEVIKIKAFFKKSGIIRSDKRFFELEKFVFTTAFIIRKLIESKKISDELEGQKFEIEYSSVTDINATNDFSSKYNFEENYNVDIRKKIGLNLYELMSLFIHSHIFVFSYKAIRTRDHAKKIEIVVTSDWKKNKIFFLKLSDFLEVSKLAYTDQINYMSMGKKKKTDEFRSILIKSRNKTK